MPEIVPRWEWRVAGEAAEAAARRLADLTPERERESDELYVLSANAEDSVKVRDGLLDVKHLERVERRGARAVAPGAQGRLPALGGGRRHRCSARCGVTGPAAGAPRTRSTSSSTSSCGPTRRPARGRGAQAARPYTVGGCMAELTDVRAGGALDAHDRGRVRGPGARARPPCAALGLGAAPNTSVPRGLKALVGFGRAALRGDRRRHELGQVPRRRAPRRRRVAARSSTAPR